jgi:imidazolonepropionase-like amidohydrolase
LVPVTWIIAKLPARLAFLFLVLAGPAFTQRGFTPGVKPFVSVDAPVIALTHVRVVDGTGAAAVENQTVVIDHGKIVAAGPFAGTPAPAGAQVMDLTGKTVIPGLVGMHEHLFYPSGGGIPMYNEMAFSFPRLYLASGITTARTGGSLEPYADLNVKRLIDAGRMPGPKMYITGPYLEGKGSFGAQMHELSGPDDAIRTVDYWASEGATSFKAYMNITHAELAAAVDEAHKRGIKVTGHLCSIGFREAAAIGIDNLEHGLLVDTEFHPGKQPDVCPPQGVTRAEMDKLDIKSAPLREMIADLVQHHVAITSTLSVFEAFDGSHPPLEQRFLDVLSPEAAVSYLSSRARARGGEETASMMQLRKELEFEYAFVKAGGLLMFGCDPTGNGGAMAGFGDQRNLELLVQGGFTPVEAIRIATSNGAKFLGELDHFGTVTTGKQADLVVIDGNPAARIADIRKISLVFKDGIGYDPDKLIESIRGAVAMH